MEVRGAWARVCVALAFGALGAMAAVGAVGCGDDSEEPRPVDVERPDAAPMPRAACAEVADHVMNVCGRMACSGDVVLPCREHLIVTCEQDFRDADAVFKYMCRRNARQCAEALACTL